MTLTCHLTPGHTKGCTTWTMYVTEDGKVQHVLFFGSTSILQGVPLLNNPQYPGIAEDSTASYKKLKSLPCDVFLAPHAVFFNLEAQAKRLEQGEKPNPFIDSTAFKTFLEHAERTFLVQLDSDRKSASACNALGNGYGYPNGAKRLHCGDFDAAPARAETHQTFEKISPARKRR